MTEQDRWPTPDDTERGMAADRARALGQRARDIIRGGGSFEGLEMAGDLVDEMGSATAKALTGKWGARMITSEETDRKTERMAWEGDNPYPRLSLDESKEYVILRNMAERGGMSQFDKERYNDLQRKILNRE